METVQKLALQDQKNCKACLSTVQHAEDRTVTLLAPVFKASDVAVS